MNVEFELCVSPEGVDLWLNKRMPLQPVGETLIARVKLQEALRLLQPEPANILLAEYFSADSSFFDVENVLIYNIGTGAFRDAARFGLRFLRYRKPPPPTPSGRVFSHLHRYRFVSPPALPEGHTFQFKVPQLTASLKPHDIWWLASDARCSTVIRFEGAFSLYLVVTTTKPISNIAAVLKPLLDGVICAMHSDARPNEEAVRRLVKRMGWGAALVTQKLREPNVPFLGDRRLLAPYRAYVKWDPADHLCECCTLVVLSGIEDRCAVTVRIHEDSGAIAKSIVAADRV